MKLRNILVSAAMVISSAGMAYAGAKEDVQAAAQKLGASENYSWTSTSEGGFSSKQEGKWQKDGLTLLSQTFRNNSVEIVFKGKKGAIKTADGWQSLAEASDPNAARGPGRFLARIAENYTTPAKEAEEAAGKVSELKLADGVYSGDLTEAGAKDLMRFGRRGGNGPEISGAKGSVKFWVADGMLTKAVYHVQGTVSFNGNDRDLDRTTTTEFKDVGTTKIEVPADAKAKMQ